MVNTRHMCVGSIILGAYGELRTHVCGLHNVRNTW